MNLQRAVDLDVKLCLGVLKRRWWALLLALVCGLGLGSGAAWLTDARQDYYTATASVYSFCEDSFDNSSQGKTALFAYSDTVKSHAMAEKIEEELDIEGLTADLIYQMLRVDERIIQATTYVYENQASVLRIYADCPYSSIAEKVADTAADLYVEQINKLFPDAFLQVLDYASGAELVVDGRQQAVMVTVLGGVGLLLACAGYLVCTVLFSRKILTVREASLYGTLDVLAVFPVYGETPPEAPEEVRT